MCACRHGQGWCADCVWGAHPSVGAGGRGRKGTGKEEGPEAAQEEQGGVCGENPFFTLWDPLVALRISLNLLWL